MKFITSLCLLFSIWSTPPLVISNHTTPRRIKTTLYKEHLLKSNYKLLPKEFIRRLTEDLQPPDARRYVIHYGQRNPPTDRMVKLKTIDLMKQAIYASQGNLKVLDRISSLTSHDIAYRMAFIFSTLDKLRQDSMAIYAVAYRQIHKMPINNHLYYLEYVAKKNVDVTYISEYVIRYYNELTKYAENLNAKLEQDNAALG